MLKQNLAIITHKLLNKGRPSPSMGGDIPKVNIAAQDRILLHLLHQHEWANRYVVPQAMTRPGIAEACAQHPPNVSRTMRNLSLIHI